MPNLPPAKAMGYGSRMLRQWTLAVDGLAKIEHAEVRLHPLLLFVGDNNSGKSMLASLLWGMYALRWDLFPEKLPLESASHGACERWLRERHAQRETVPRYTLTDEDEALFLRWLNDRLDENRQDIARLLFGDETLAPSRLEVREPGQRGNISLSWKLLAGSDALSVEDEFGSEVIFPDQMASDLKRYSVLYHLASKLFLQPMPLGQPRFDGAYQEGDPVYLPASRSGFMLLYKDVVRRRSRRADRGGDEGGALTAPVLHFLDLLAFGLKKQQGNYANLAALLERAAYEGTLELAPGDVVNEFHYRYAEGRGPLRMALASSLVTELAPVVMVLRHLSGFPILVLEEPEAHLHPRLQRVLARVIVRLVRRGLCVWVTTHNENFCQQINNFIKIGAHPERARLQKQEGYDADDYLLVDEIAGYQFLNRGERSQVTELPKTDQGLAMPTFNEELVSLMKQTLALEKEAEKAE